MSGSNSPADCIAQNIAALRERIAQAARRAGRLETDITLVAVSKTHPASAVQSALKAGQLVFGENRVQEAAAKFPGLRAAQPQLKLHLIGPLQTNKAEQAVAIADVIETLDRPRLADALERASDRLGRLPELMVQVNIGDEPQKSGVSCREAEAFITACQHRFGARLTGIMCIPPLEYDPIPYFRLAARLRLAHGLPALSMGMSGDFERAIAEGATHVRVGTAIFGRR